MDYLTNYYKNLSEQLQEQINLLENQINEANIRNPRLQLRAEYGDYNNPNRVTRHNTVERGFPSDSGGAGWKRMNDMVKFKAALEIAHPHEKEAIEAVLTDMANTSQEAPGTAANASHIRTALGAIKRLSGTEAFQTSFKNLESKIDRKASDEVLGGDDPIHFYSGRLSREEDDRFADAKFAGAQREVLGYSGSRNPKTIKEESESNKRELERINQDRKAEGKPPFRTLDQALTHYEKEDERARRKKYGKG